MIALDNPLGLTHYLTWLFGTLAVSYALMWRYQWTVGLAFAFTVISAIRVFQTSLNGLPDDPIVRLIHASAQGALVSFLLTVLIAQALSVKNWIRVFQVVAFANALALIGHSIYFIFQGLFSGLPLVQVFQFEPWGILFNASMSGCLNAAIFPLIDSKQKFLRGLVLVSVIVAGRSLPVAVLFVGIGSGFFLQRRLRALLLAIPASLIVGYLLKGGDLFASRGRTVIWGKTLSMFQEKLNMAIGSGLGGYYVAGPLLLGPSTIAFIWAHSDWLQILFEQGIIGFLIVLAMYIHALWRTRKTPQLFSALMAYGAFGVANMPLRYPISGLLGAFLIRWAMEKDKA